MEKKTMRANEAHAAECSQRLASKASRNLGGKFAKKAQVRGMLVGEDTYSCYVNVLSITPHNNMSIHHNIFTSRAPTREHEGGL